LLNLLLLLLLVLLLLLLLILVLDLGLILLFFFLLLLFALLLLLFLLLFLLFLFLFFDLLFLARQQLARVLYELSVPLHEVLDGAVLEVFGLILLEVENDLRAATKRLAQLSSNGEVATSLRLPAILLVIVVLGDDLNLVGDEVGRVKADTELTDH